MSNFYRGRAVQIVIGAYDYFAERSDDGLVWSDLDMRFDIELNSPDGPCWGYGGSGPHQLALALLADALEDEKMALEMRWEFVCGVVSQWDQFSDWTISKKEIIERLLQPGKG